MYSIFDIGLRVVSLAFFIYFFLLCDRVLLYVPSVKCGSSVFKWDLYIFLAVLIEVIVALLFNGLMTD